ncbi:hypothetical protein ACFOD4_09600 [Pseudoroseomonas globiformis]|uniref:Haloacid dehalogenase-like hydrolase n=1 Tax=Teichococcus globiformis TaxID=2307229 RepID=A0ABV7G2Q6_9PROT
MSETRDRLARRDLESALCERASTDQGRVFVDFDHTVFSCNSTELFIASCKPAFMAAAIDFIVRDCVPWRLTGLPRWFRLRDYVCVALIVLLMPWTLLAWRRNAPALFARHESRVVLDGLSRLPADRIVLVTFGMEFIVRDLLRGSRWEAVPRVATPWLPGLGHFRQGKLGLLTTLFGREEVAASTAISDSLDDRDLLSAARHGILIEPQGEEFRASERLYFPLRYTIRAKYNLSYAIDQILLVDVLLLVLAVSTSLHEVAWALLIMPFFVISLMAVYEMGYFENDMVASRSEAKPTLSPEMERFRDYPIFPSAWFWAAGLGAAGCALASFADLLPSLDMFAAMASWAISLLLLRVLFFIYNRQDVQSRVFIYPVLQLMKYLPVFFLLRPTEVGVVLALAQVTTMWAIYTTYRLGGRHKTLKKEAFRTTLWGVGLCLLATTGVFSFSENLLPVGLMLVWCLARLSKSRVLDMARRYRQRDLGSAASSA